jgi:ferredoxin
MDGKIKNFLRVQYKFEILHLFYSYNIIGFHVIECGKDGHCEICTCIISMHEDLMEVRF